MFSISAMPIRFDQRFTAIFCALASPAIASAQDDRVISPDRRYAVVPIEVQRAGMDADSYAIRFRRTGKTLAVCPEDDRFSSAMGTVIWSPSSRLVSVSTRTSRPGSFPDVWHVTAGKATKVNADFSQEEGRDLYVTPERWRDSRTLEGYVFGRSPNGRRRVPPYDPWMTYSFVVRIARDGKSAKVTRAEPKYGGGENEMRLDPKPQ